MIIYISILKNIKKIEVIKTYKMLIVKFLDKSK